ncbi:hypothetical protein [Chitinophaga rhizophila]|uniref:Secreted protein n=1 Tax=Chitinophaga rhizophila TaxID=2866212 RepID=A0ABS7G6N7_9BACT|nr:hypothetical protein [Chitinophaga rhizophila]MBW8683321.1 hypothetical protein [Chitinophaga rhizophila]
MKKIVSALLVGCYFSTSSFAQNVTCGQAVSQLQQYAGQVNQIYQNEYWQNIPNVRCPAYVTNQWGQAVPVNPQVVQNCRWQMLSSLNQWYGLQCQYVNNWYAQIVRGCAVEQSTEIVRPAPDKRSGNEENSEIDTDEIEELTAGIDEDKALKISIPKTASGYKPKF